MQLEARASVKLVEMEEVGLKHCSEVGYSSERDCYLKQTKKYINKSTYFVRRWWTLGLKYKVPVVVFCVLQMWTPNKGMTSMVKGHFTWTCMHWCDHVNKTKSKMALLGPEMSSLKDGGGHNFSSAQPGVNSVITIQSWSGWESQKNSKCQPLALGHKHKWKYHMFRDALRGQWDSNLKLWSPATTSLCDLTFGFRGLRVGMSVPAALCLLESKTFLRLDADFWQILECFSWRKRETLSQEPHQIPPNCNSQNKFAIIKMASVEC